MTAQAFPSWPAVKMSKSGTSPFVRCVRQAAKDLHSAEEFVDNWLPTPVQEPPGGHDANSVLASTDSRNVRRSSMTWITLNPA